MKKRILTVLVAILTVIPFVLIYPKAEDPLTPVTKDYVITSYGNYYVECSTVPSGASLTVGDSSSMGVQFSMPVGTGGCSVTFVYNFESERSGTMRLNLTLPLSVTLKSCSFAITGGRFTNMTSITTQGTNKIFDVKFQDTKGIAFTLFLPANNTNFDSILHPITLSNISIQDGVGLFDIDATLDSIDSSLDLYLPGMSTNLSNIASNTSTIAADLAIIKGYLDGLEGYTDNIEPILEQLEIVSMYNIEPYQHSAWFWCSKYDSSFPRWKYGLPYMQYKLDWNNSSYTASKAFRLSQGYSYIMVFYSSVAITVSDITLYYSATTGNVSVTSLPINEITSQLYLQAFIFKNENNGFSTFEPEINKTFEMYPLYFGLTNNIPDDINMLLGREYDNTYTRLLQQISNGVNGTYDTSEYEQLDQVVDNLTDNLLIDVNNSKDSVLTDISTQSGIGQGLNLRGVQTIVNGLFTDIITIIPPLKYLVILGLIIMILGVVL